MLNSFWVKVGLGLRIDGVDKPWNEICDENDVKYIK